MITSSTNARIKNLAALQKKAKERKEQKAFVAEGPRMVFETPAELMKELYVSESFLNNESHAAELEDYLKRSGLPEYEVLSDPVMKAVSDTQNPQGVMALVEMPAYQPEDLMQGEKTLILTLESIQDPGNLGTMIRTGEGAGVTGILVNRETVDLFNPKTIRSTMGSLYRIPFLVTDDLEEEISLYKEKGVRFYAAHLKGKKAYDGPDYTGPTAFLIGNEGRGLSDRIADAADDYIRIPMEGKVESLNAAVSAALLMYECSRQRRRRIEDLV